jgi:hypothetical protein
LHENLHIPSAKSELLKCLPLPQQTEPRIHFDCKDLDGAVIIHSLPITDAVTFDQYAERVFIPHILQAKIPSKWFEFLRDPANKTKWFAFLKFKVEAHVWPAERIVNITSGNVCI